MAKKKDARFNTPVRIRFHSLRHRLADPDGISGKAALDGLVHAGILQDDSVKEIIEPVIHTQEKIPLDQQETTIITIEEVK